MNSETSDRKQSSFSDQDSEVRELLGIQSTSWNSGERRRLEELLSQATLEKLHGTPDHLMMLICHEVALRDASGDKAQLSEYQSRFPKLASQLAIQWEIDEFLRIEPSRNGHDHLTVQLPIGQATKEPNRLPDRIGRYEVIAELGRGGAGVVYEAWDPKLRRSVAIKQLRSGENASPEELGRIRAEAEAIANIRHPNVVQIYDVEDLDGFPFLAMELCTGRNLSARLDGKPLEPKQTAELVLKICLGIAAAHKARIIHRDLKPSNVLLESENEWNPKVTDFGLAKLMSQDISITASGMIVGTPAYMPPEQTMGRTTQVDVAVDVYAIGTILYECLTGRPPFRGASIVETLDMVRNNEPISIRHLEPKVPIDLQTIAEKCLRKEPEKRYATVPELIADLQNFLERRPIHARRRNLVDRCISVCRRKPALTFAFASVVAVVVSSIILLSWMNLKVIRESNSKTLALSERIAALDEKSLALKAKEDALEASRKSEQLANQRYYNAKISVAQQAILRSEMARAEDLLLPFDTGQANLDQFEWKLLCRILLRDLVWSNNEEKREATCALFSPEEDLLLISGGDMFSGFVRMFHASSGAMLFEKGLSAIANACAFHPQGHVIAVALGNGDVSIRDVKTGEIISLFKTGLSCKSMLWSPDGKRLYFGDENGKLGVWDAINFQQLAVIDAEAGPILRMFASKDESQLYTSIDWGKNGRHSTQWSIENDEPKLGQQYADISLTDISADGLELLGMAWGDLVLADTKTGRTLKSLPFSTGPLLSVRFVEGESRIMLASRNDRELRFLSTDDFELLQAYQVTKSLCAVAYSPLRKQWVTCGSSGEVRMWQHSPKNSPVIDTLEDRVYTYATFLGDSHNVILGSDGPTQLWNTTTLEFESFHHQPKLVAISAAGETFIHEEMKSESSTTFAVSQKDNSDPYSLEVPYQIYENCLTLSANGRWLATRGEGRHIDVFDLRQRSPTPFAKVDARCYGFAFSPDERLLAGGVQYGAVVCYDLRTQEPLPDFEKWQSYWSWGLSSAFSHDGKYLASGNESGLIQVWNVQTQEKIASLSGNQGEVLCLAFFPDGRRLLSGGSRDVRIWDFIAGQEIVSLPVPDDQAAKVSISQDGNAVLALTPKGRVRVWRVQDASRPE